MNKTKCINPQLTYYYGDTHPGGAPKWSYKKRDNKIELSRQYRPCRYCVNCSRKASYEIATKIMLECQQWKEHNWFITLTVDDEHMEEVFPNGSLSHEKFAIFMRDLRLYLTNHNIKTPMEIKHPKDNNKTFKGVRVNMCGEYGPLKHRPHFHAILHNIDLEPYQYPVTKNGKRLTNKEGEETWSNTLLERFWTYGFVSVKRTRLTHAVYLAKYMGKNTRNRVKQSVLTKEMLKRGMKNIRLKRSQRFKDNFEIERKEYMQTPKEFMNGLVKYYEKKHLWFKQGYIELHLGENRDRKKFTWAIPQSYRDLYRVEHPELYQKYKEKIEAYNNSKSDEQLLEEIKQRKSMEFSFEEDYTKTLHRMDF